jgi:DNA-binding transcriptional ArsR family regulator
MGERVRYQRNHGGVVKKLSHPEKKDLDLCKILDALSDPLRLAIVRQIWEQGECKCCSFTEPKAKSTRSHHFKVLRESGIIMTRITGTEFGLSIRKDEIDERFPGLLDSIFSAQNRNAKLKKEPVKACSRPRKK